MNKIEQISTSNVKIDDLYNYNDLINFVARKKNSEGKAFNTPHLIEPEVHYSSDPWQYSINSYGFRGPEWTFQKTPAFFGCSFIFGVGVEVPVSEILAKELNHDSIPNLGMPGSSAVNIIKLFSAFTRLHPVSDAVIILPALNRSYVPQYDDRWYHLNYLPFHPRGDKKLFKKVIQVFNEDVLVSYISDYIDWANEIAINRGITVYWGSWSYDTAELLKKKNINSIWWHNLDKARDGAHPGKKSHEFLSNTIYEKISKVNKL